MSSDAPVDIEDPLTDDGIALWPVYAQRLVAKAEAYASSKLAGFLRDSMAEVGANLMLGKSDRRSVVLMAARDWMGAHSDGRMQFVEELMEMLYRADGGSAPVSGFFRPRAADERSEGERMEKARDYLVRYRRYMNLGENANVPQNQLGILLRVAMSELSHSALSVEERCKTLYRVLAYAVGSQRELGLFLHAALKAAMPVMQELLESRRPAFLPVPSKGGCGVFSCMS